MKLKYYLRGLGIGMVVTALLMGFTTKGKEMSDEEIKARAMELGMVEQRTLADIRDSVSEVPLEATSKPTVEQQGTETGENSQGASSTIADDTEIGGNIGDNSQQNTNTAGGNSQGVTGAIGENGQEAGDNTEKTEQGVSGENNQENSEDISVEKPQETEFPIGQQTQTTEAPIATAPPKSTEKPTAVPEGSGEATELTRAPIAEMQGDIAQVTIFEGNNSIAVCKVLEEVGLVENATAFDRYLIKNGYSKIINTGTYKIALGTSEADVARIITNTN